MRVWFVTGASRGFGALIAEAALAAGDAVVATARDPSTVTARLGSHERLLATRLDVTSETEAWTKETEERELTKLSLFRRDTEAKFPDPTNVGRAPVTLIIPLMFDGIGLNSEFPNAAFREKSAMTPSAHHR